MKIEDLVKDWFEKWKSGDYSNLPISEDFKHTSPFGTINGKKEYLDLVDKNQEKFLGYTFEIHDTLYVDTRACVRYTARQGKDFKLDVSEWYYIDGNQIKEIIAHYHIGEIREERQLNS